MRMVQCPNGHFYDAEKNPSCPYCVGDFANVNLGRTVGIQQDFSNNFGGNTMGVNSYNTYDDYDIGKTVALDGCVDDDIGKTVALFKQSSNSKVDPVVGWLVCVDGESKGKDYKIHSDNNFIGRSKNMDICIEEDKTISRENHAIIAYDTKYKKFYFTPGEGRAIVRINEESIFKSTQLQDYDIIEIGETKLVFVSFCGEKFSWN